MTWDDRCYWSRNVSAFLPRAKRELLHLQSGLYCEPQKNRSTWCAIVWILLFKWIQGVCDLYLWLGIEDGVHRCPSLRNCTFHIFILLLRRSHFTVDYKDKYVEHHLLPSNIKYLLRETWSEHTSFEGYCTFYRSKFTVPWRKDFYTQMDMIISVLLCDEFSYIPSWIFCYTFFTWVQTRLLSRAISKIPTPISQKPFIELPICRELAEKLLFLL